VAFALVTSVKSGTNSGGTTSSGIDTSGADLLVMVVGHYAGASTPAVSDSKGNTWTALTAYTEAGDITVTVFYAKNATVGSGHTFTVSGANCYAGICVGAFSGSNTTAPFDAVTGSNGNNSTSNPGSLTPSEANCLVIVGANMKFEHLSSIGSGYTIAQDLTPSAGSWYGTTLCYIVQTSAAATNPTLTYTTATAFANAIASFKAAGAGGSAIKTINGLARASIKTINGLAIASVKTFNGLA